MFISTVRQLADASHTLDEAWRKRPRLQPCVDSDFWGLGPCDGDLTPRRLYPHRQAEAESGLRDSDMMGKYNY